MNPNFAAQRGVTFVELVVSIVVIGVALAGIMLVFTRTVARSADPVLVEQAVAIAEAYMEEITLKPFLDPDTGTDCPAPEADRTQFDNVCDYDSHTDIGARDQGDNAISGLGQYTVQVMVASEAINGVPAAAAKRVEVRVTHAGAAGVDVLLSGYRTNY